MKVYLEVYGCTANQSDVSLAIGLLKKNNYEIVEEIDDADVLILLTCTVIGTTEQRMLSRLRKFKSYGKEIIVSGCMASVQADLVKSIVPEVKLLPPQYTSHIVDLLEDKKIPENPKSKTLLSKSYKDVIAPISISDGPLSCAPPAPNISIISGGRPRSNSIVGISPKYV